MAIHKFNNECSADWMILADYIRSIHIVYCTLLHFTLWAENYNMPGRMRDVYERPLGNVPVETCI